MKILISRENRLRSTVLLLPTKKYKFHFGQRFLFLGFLLSIFFFSTNSLAQEPLELIYRMEESYKKVDDYRTTFIRQERIEGKLKDLEEVELEFKRPFMVKMLWKKGPKKGRTVVFVEGENENKVLVRMEGLLGRFVKLLRLDPEGKLATQGGKRTIKQAGLGNLIQSLVTLTREAETAGNLRTHLLGEEMIGDRPAYMIERILVGPQYDSPRTLIYIDKELTLPVQVLRFNQAGELFERYEYEDLKINQDLSKTTFQMTNELERSPSEENLYLQKASAIIQDSLAAYKNVEDYSAQFRKQEKIGSQLFPEQLYEIKFKKPSFLYLKILKGKYEGTEIYYPDLRQGEGEEGRTMIVQPGGLIGGILSTLNLDEIKMSIDSKPAKEDNRHLVSEFGIGHFLEKYQSDFEHALKEKDFFIDIIPKTIDGNAGQQIELILKNKKKLDQYYAYRTLAFFSEKWKLPTEIKVFDVEGDLVEHYSYSDLKLNQGLTEVDFMPPKKDKKAPVNA